MGPNVSQGASLTQNAVFSMSFSHSVSIFRQRYGWSMVAGLYGVGFLVMLRVAYLGQLPGWFSAIPHYDKPGHVVLYGIATYLGHRLLRDKRWKIGGWALPLFPLAFAIFTTVEELAQGLSPNRSLDAIDLICSLVGCWMGYRLAERHLRNCKITKPQHR